jgi:hypothetical protein
MSAVDDMECRKGYFDRLPNINNTLLNGHLTLPMTVIEGDLIDFF